MRTVRLSLAGMVVVLVGGLSGAVAAQSEEPEQDVEWPQLTRGIVYGEDDSVRQVIHVFEPEPRAEPRPAVVFFHGGGLIMGSPLQDCTITPPVTSVPWMSSPPSTSPPVGDHE